jgi:hypothetical protein
MESGEIWEMLSGGRPAALHFRGKGNFEYRSVDPIEFALFEHNAKRNSSLKPERGTSDILLREPIKEVVIWLGGRSFPIPGVPLENPSTSRIDWFNQIQGWFAKEHTFNRRGRLHRLLAYHALNAPELPLLGMQIDGENEQLDYLFDPVLTARETLRCNRQGGSFELSSQAIGWDRKSPLVSIIQLSHIDVDLESVKPTAARLVTTETIEVTSPGLQVLWLDLISPFNEEKNPAFRLTSVQDEKGLELAFIHRGGDLLFEVPEALKQGKSVKFRFEMQGDFLFHPTDSSYWKLGVFPWFPQPPDLAGQAYSVHATIKVAKPYRPIVAGLMVRQVEEPGSWIVETRIEKPVQFFVIDAGKFEIHENRQGERVVRVVSFLGGGRNIEKLGRMAHQYIDLYQSMLGPFPFQSFNIIQQLEYGYGQAPPGTMYITKEAFDSITNEMDRAFSKGINQRFAHEIAHQYWGIQVKMPSMEEQWITEGFAEYCSALAMKQTKGFGEAKYQDMAKEWKEHAKDSTGKATIPVANQIRDISKWYEAFQARKNLIYDKSAYLLFRLHGELGDARFRIFLQTLLKTFSWKFATTLDIQDLSTLLSKKDYAPFFNRYYWSTELP